MIGYLPRGQFWVQEDWGDNTYIQKDWGDNTYIQEDWGDNTYIQGKTWKS